MRLKKRIFPLGPNYDHLLVTNSISPKQIAQLISITKSDEAVQKFTEDLRRFKDKAAFTAWQKTGRIIYTLTDKDESLIGLLWFSPKPFLNRKYTFAIRIYGPNRGKHLAAGFMHVVFDDFKPASLWLKTSKENSIALNLYTNFGFKKISEDDRSIFMALG